MLPEAVAARPLTPPMAIESLPDAFALLAVPLPIAMPSPPPVVPPPAVYCARAEPGAPATPREMSTAETPLEPRAPRPSRLRFMPSAR